jgi:hypothetical protein
MGTLEWLGAPEWFPATVVGINRRKSDEWSVLLRIASGTVIPLLVTGVSDVQDKKPIAMVVEKIALVTEGGASYVEFRASENDDASIGFEGTAVRMEIGRY